MKLDSCRMKPTVWSASSRHARLCTVLTALRHWEGTEGQDGVTREPDASAPALLWGGQVLGPQMLRWWHMGGLVS